MPRDSGVEGPRLRMGAVLPFPSLPGCWDNASAPVAIYIFIYVRHVEKFRSLNSDILNEFNDLEMATYRF